MAAKVERGVRGWELVHRLPFCLLGKMQGAAHRVSIWDVPGLGQSELFVRLRVS